MSVLEWTGLEWTALTRIGREWIGLEWPVVDRRVAVVWWVNALDGS